MNNSTRDTLIKMIF